MAIFKSYFKEGMSTSKIKTKASRSGINERNRYVTIFGWLIFLLAYGFLIPGLILPLYYYLVQGIRVEKTLMTTVDMLKDQGAYFAAVLLIFFGIAVPAIKLVMVGYAHWKNAAWASRFVVWISKWAIVDAVIASFIMAYYANAFGGAIISRIDVGFIFFTLYCTLSTAAALILDDRDVEFSEIYESRKYFKDNEWLEKRSNALYAVAGAFGLSVAAMILYTVRMGMNPELISMSVFSACNRLLTEKNADPRPMVIILLFVVMTPLIEFVFMGFMIYKPKDNFYTRCALRCLPQCGLLDVYAVSVVVMDLMLNALGVMTVSIPPLGFTILCVSVGATIFARFVLGRYLARMFGGAESTTPLERTESPAVMTVDSERVVAIAV
jgi:uncharacterized paraquat-inducible protein A